jgi:hypothetical protein
MTQNTPSTSQRSYFLWHGRNGHSKVLTSVQSRIYGPDRVELESAVPNLDYVRCTFGYSS